MADIEVVCPNCSVTITVSEFADPEKLVCRKCGSSVPMPRKEPEETSAPSARFEVKRSDSGPGEPASAAKARAAAVPRRKRRRPRRLRGLPAQLAQNTVFAWVLFVITGACTGLLRYGGFLPTEYLELIKEHSVILVIAFHVMVVIKAFSDSVFQGILCLLVPLYSVFYLFTFCDDFVLRAVFGGLLIGTAQDSALAIHREFGETVQAVQTWLNQQGEYGG